MPAVNDLLNELLLKHLFEDSFVRLYSFAEYLIAMVD